MNVIILATALAIVCCSDASAGSIEDSDAGKELKAPATVVEIIRVRCAVCHAPEPGYQGSGSPPNGILLDSPEAIAQQKRAINVVTVLTHFMPPNNLTEMTPEERGVLAQWSNHD